ncbi:hypothetical protein EVA_02626 [gut metagenome]|uniref:Uncharacterized protein n=1 Tax=gut metagenome TaxID=749906 RepID=J9D8W8_9ZZZZ
MADGLDLVAEDLLQRFVETVERRVHRYAYAPVIEVVEAVGRVAHLHLPLRIPVAFHTFGVHDVAEREVRRYVDVFEQLEGRVHRDAVLQTVAPVLDDVRFEQFVFRCRDAVGELTAVRHRDLLIPSLLARLLFAAEGVEAVECHGELGEAHRHRRVAHILCQVGRSRDVQTDVGEVVRVAHRTGTGALRIGERVVHALQVFALIVFRSEVDASGETRVRVCLVAHAVRPLELEALCHRIVRHILFALHRMEEAEVEVTAVFVALVVVDFVAQSPRTLGIDFAQHLHVHIVVDGEVVAPVAQVEAADGLVAIDRHDEAARVALVEGEETVGDGEWQRHVLHHEIGRSEHRFLSRLHLGSREFQVEVGVFSVAGRIFRMLQVERSVLAAFGVRAVEKAVALRGGHIADESLFGFEVEGYLFAVVVVAALLVDGRVDQHAGSVAASFGMHQAAVHVHGDGSGIELHVDILHIGLAVEIGQSYRGVVDHGVGGGIVNGRVQSAVLLLDRVGSRAVRHHAVRHHAVCRCGHREAVRLTAVVRPCRDGAVT